MLPSTHRLRRSADFQRTVRRGARSGRTTVVAHVLVDDQLVENTTSAGPLVGFVVSKAVGNSVQRNRVKRRLRETVRPLLDPHGAVPLPVRAHIVLRALPASSTATTAELRADVHGAIAKAVQRQSRSVTRASSPVETA